MLICGWYMQLRGRWSGQRDEHRCDFGHGGAFCFTHKEIDMKSLLRSRKFWLAVFGIVQALVLHYLRIPDEIWQSIAGLVAVLIASIAYEDAAGKRGWVG